jgi:excisionase family DNA binding protein
VPNYRISEVASLLGVSDDTVRRWADSGRLPTVREPGTRMAVDGVVAIAAVKSTNVVVEVPQR